jgi:hypothetical protein
MVVVAYIISIDIDNSNPNIVVGFILVFLFILLAFSLVFFLTPRAFLSKFTLSNDKISWTIFRKTIIELAWEEIVDVKIEYRFYRKCLVFDITKHVPGFKRNELYFNVDKKNITSVFAYCKNDVISNKLNNFIINKDYETHYVIWKRN